MRGYRNGHYRYLLLRCYVIATHGRNEMKLWDATLPAGEFFQVYAENEKEARKMARFYLGVEKLPKGTEIVSG